MVSLMEADGVSTLQACVICYYFLCIWQNLQKKKEARAFRQLCNHQSINVLGGYCEQKETVLVAEFMYDEALAKHLFRSKIVVEIHHLYRFQNNLMDDFLRQEQYKNRIMYEASSSSNILPSQITPDDAHLRNSSGSLFTNSVCDDPPVSVQAIVQSSAGSNHK